jgi:adenosine deaminase
MFFKARHSGRDSCQAILPDTLRVNANLFQTDLCRNPDAMDGKAYKHIDVFWMSAITADMTAYLVCAT